MHTKAEGKRVYGIIDMLFKKHNTKSTHFEHEGLVLDTMLSDIYNTYLVAYDARPACLLECNIDVDVVRRELEPIENIVVKKGPYYENGAQHIAICSKIRMHETDLILQWLEKDTRKKNGAKKTVDEMAHSGKRDTKIGELLGYLPIGVPTPDTEGKEKVYTVEFRTPEAGKIVMINGWWVRESDFKSKDFRRELKKLHREWSTVMRLADKPCMLVTYLDKYLPCNWGSFEPKEKHADK